MKKILLVWLIGLVFVANPTFSSQYSFSDENKNVSSADTEDFEKSLEFGISIVNDFLVFTPPGIEGKYEPGALDEDLDDFTEDLDQGTTSFLAEKLGLEDNYYMRIDLSCDAQLSQNTNLYSLLALRVLDQDSGAQDDFSYAILRCEVEHALSELCTFRIGRLNEKYSESRLFGRVAMGEADIHIFGRVPFVNDSVELELDGEKADIPLDLTTGVKYEYKPIEMSSVFLIPQLELPFGKNTVKSFLVYSYNRQKEEDLELLFPSTENDRFYHGLEGEISFNMYADDNVVSYINAGFVADYKGYAPHYSGPFDITNGNAPIISDPEKSISQSMIAVGGIRLNPSGLFDSLGFFKELSYEFEYVGVTNDDVSALNSYIHSEFTYSDISFIYGIYMNQIRFSDVESLEDAEGTIVLATDELNNFVHFFRLKVSF